jgi:anti-sigma regulatory factor (Ser/Thr protein kinase)
VEGGSEEGERMQVDQRGALDGYARERGGESAELVVLRATCRRQGCTIETMARLLGDLRGAVSALEGETAELRAAGTRVGDLRCSPASVDPAHGSRESVEARVPLDARAPGAARIIVAALLADRVAATVLERAQLVMSELVANSVRHSGMPADAGVLVRVRLLVDGFCLEAEDPGRDGVVAQHAANPRSGGGFGLHIRQALSERWGIERAAQGGTRVWAELSDTAPPAGPGFGEHVEAMPSRAAPACTPTAGTTPPRQRERAGVPGRSADVHVVPRPRAATWGVYDDAVAGALSEHTSETEAEAAARAHLRTRGPGRIVVHDRYHRTHPGAPARAN